MQHGVIVLVLRAPEVLHAQTLGGNMLSRDTGTPGLDRRYAGGLGRSKNCGIYPCRGMSALATREASTLLAFIRREICTRP